MSKQTTPVFVVGNELVDAKYGPYLSTTQCTNLLLIGDRKIGQTVGIYNGTGIDEYWFRDGIEDTDLIYKTSISEKYIGINTIHNITATGTIGTTTVTLTDLLSYPIGDSLSVGSYIQFETPPTGTVYLVTDIDDPSASTTDITVNTALTDDPGSGKIRILSPYGVLNNLMIGDNLTLELQNGVAFLSATVSTPSVAWGDITGTLSDQTDLQSALDGKVDENVSITGATKTKITYDSKGLVTAGADAGISDITDLQTELDAKFNLEDINPICKLAENISKGQAVYVSSATGTNMIVSKASNAAEATSSKTFGLLSETGVTNDQIRVITNGFLTGLNTASATIGDAVWLGTSGNLIFWHYGGGTTKPVAPAHLVFIGIVTRVHAVNGEIFVKVQNGFELDEIHDVLITSAATNDFLYYASDGLWKNKQLGASDMPTGIDATKIGAGAVSNTEFGYLDGVTSAIQTQLSGKEPTITSGTSSQFFKGDKTWATISASDIPSSVDATKIANGSVSNTEFQYLDGVTSSIQTQFGLGVVSYSAAVASITSGGSAAETTIQTLTIPAGAFKSGDNILLTLWGSRTTGASTGVNSTLTTRITNISGSTVYSNATGNRHHNYTLTGRCLSDTSIIWWQNSVTTAAATTTVPSLSSSGFTLNFSVTRTANTDEFTLYNAICRKYN